MIDLNQAKGDYEKASKLMYVVIPTLQKQLESLEEEISKNKNVLIKDCVDEIDVAEILDKERRIGDSGIS